MVTAMAAPLPHAGRTERTGQAGQTAPTEQTGQTGHPEYPEQTGKTGKTGKTEPAKPTGQLGERLARADLISADQLQIALLEQKRSGGLLGAILVRLGFLDENKLATVLAERAGLSSIDLKRAPLDPALMRKWPKSVAQRCRAVPISLDRNLLEIAMADPYDIVAMDEIRRRFPRDVTLVPRVAAAADIAETLANYDDTRATL